jgi:p24 family protein delta-1
LTGSCLTCLHFFGGSLFQVTSPFGDIVHKKEKVSMGQFAFTTAEAGNYLACFSIDGEDRGLVVKLNLDWKIGLASRDWDSVAKKEKIEVKYIKK